VERLTNIKTMETKGHFYARKRDKGSCGDILKFAWWHPRIKMEDEMAKCVVDNLKFSIEQAIDNEIETFLIFDQRFLP